LTAVDEFSRKARGMKLGVKVKDVVLELLVAKKQDGLSHRYQLQLQSNLRRFAADFDVPISHIRRDQIDDWLRKRGVAIRSRNGLLATAFSQRFGFCSRLPRNGPICPSGM
jgi:hypothetical protein